MTHPSDDPTTDLATPPPGCPAHGLVRLYGGESEADPIALYEKLRAQHGPVAPVLLEGDVPAWLVLGYHENMEAARTPSRFSRDSRGWRDWQEGKVPPESPLIPMLGWRPDCVSQDGDAHHRLRASVEDSLARFDRHGVRRHIQRCSNQLIDAFCADGRADLVAQYAQQLPMLVLTRMFGMPEEVGPRLVEACIDLIKGGENAMACNTFILQALSDFAEEKRREPGHDFASWLIAHPARLAADEVQNHLRLVMIAANETTTNLIVNTLRVVLTDPRFRASLTGGLMTVPDAVEQVLWDEPPLAVCPGRFATADMQFGGQRIKAGDLLVLGLAAGNADPVVRPDPDAPVHGNRAHLAFSRGPHECPGQDIARAITETAVDVLLARLPDVRLDGPERQLGWTASTWSRHLDALPAAFTPGRATATSAATTTAPPVSTPGTTDATPRRRSDGDRRAVANAAVPAPRTPLWERLIRRLLGR